MDQVTQHNVAQMESLRSTAQALAVEGQQLQALVGRFHLGDAHAAHPTATVAPRPAPAMPVLAVAAAGKANGVHRQARPAPGAAGEGASAAVRSARGGADEGFEEF
jgi:hypothetical protein